MLSDVLLGSELVVLTFYQAKALVDFYNTVSYEWRAQHRDAASVLDGIQQALERSEERSA